MESQQLPIVPERDALRIMYEAGEECHKEKGFYPITFTMMDPHSSLPKSQDFSRLIPGDFTTYIYGHNKEAYYDDYRRSYFAYTWKKGGWDCNRHTEILSCTSVPYMPDIGDCPKYSMFFYPKRDMKRVLGLKGIIHPHIGDAPFPFNWKILSPASIDHSSFDQDEYSRIRQKFMSHSQLYLTPESQLKYIAKCSGRDHLPSNILCYSGHQTADYLADSLIKGVVDLGIGIDYPRKDVLYSNGGSYYYDGTLRDRDSGSNRDSVIDKVKSHYFDMIIFVDAWRHLVPEWKEFEDLALCHYDKKDLIYICGSDSPGTPWNYSPGKLYFKREIY